MTEWWKDRVELAGKCSAFVRLMLGGSVSTISSHFGCGPFNVAAVCFGKITLVKASRFSHC